MSNSQKFAHGYKAISSYTKWSRLIAVTLCIASLLTLIPFSALTSLDAYAQNKILYGDVDKSGVIDDGDSVCLKKYLAEYDIEIDQVAADVNLDGMITLHDLLLLQRYLAGQDIILGEVVVISFDAKGGLPVESIKLCKGASLSSVVDETPVTEKENYIFAGWYISENTPFYPENEIESDITVYACYEKVEDKTQLNIQIITLEDQDSGLSFEIISESELSVAEVEELLSFEIVDDTRPISLDVKANSNTEFIVSAAGGFYKGCSYSLTLGDGLYYKNREKSIRTINFDIYKDEVNNVTYKRGIIYIKDTDSISYMLDGASEAVDVLEISILSNEESAENVTGYFYCPQVKAAVGDIICIYQNVHPDDRDYINNTYDDDAAAYIEVTAVDGDKISFKSVNEENADKVFFLPDSIPYSTANLPTGTQGTVNKRDYDADAWKIIMKKSDAPEFDVGDFLVFYSGSIGDIEDDSPIYYAEVTDISGDIVSYKQTTSEAIASAQDMFMKMHVSSEKLLENVNKAEIEQQVVNQVLESGFANAVAEYLATMAQKTDGFKSLEPEDIFELTAENEPLSGGIEASLGSIWDPGDSVKAAAFVDKSTEHFKDGVSLSIRITAEMTCDLGTNGKQVISFSATFVEEIDVDIEQKSYSDITWISFVPIINSLIFGINVDVKNFTAISLEASLYTVKDEQAALWNEFKQNNELFAGELARIYKLERLINRSFEDNAQIKKYQDEIDGLWNIITSKSSGSFTKEKNIELGEFFNKTDISERLLKLTEITEENKIEAGVADLMAEYFDLIKKQSSWVTIAKIDMVNTKISAYVCSVALEIDADVKLNIKAAVGANLEYLTGDRFSFWCDIIKKTTGSARMDLIDEQFAFQAYVMGILGVRVDLDIEIVTGVFAAKLGSANVDCNVGANFDMYGLFAYEYIKEKRALADNWNISESAYGAMYVEFKVTHKFSVEAKVLEYSYSYKPNFADNGVVLLVAGTPEFYYDFGYVLDEDEAIFLTDSDNDSSNGIAAEFPKGYRMMKCVNLVSGKQEVREVNLSNFIVTFSNNKFSVDPKTGLILIDTGKDIQYMECDMTITWKKSKLEFTKKDLSITVKIVWTNLSETELKQKITATVMVGSPEDGYTCVWNRNVMKNEAFDLPTEDEVLDLIGYNSYYDEEYYINLKYSDVQGYDEGQSLTDLNIYEDTDYYFDIDLMEYTLIVDEVQNADGSTKSMEFKAKYGEKFDLTELVNSGANMIAKYTKYFKTTAISKENTEQEQKEFDFDIGGVIDDEFAKMLFGNVKYTAKYLDDGVDVCFIANLDTTNAFLSSIHFYTRRGTVVSNVMFDTLTKVGYTIVDVNPEFGKVYVDTTYTLILKKINVSTFLVKFNTNGGSLVPTMYIPQYGLIYEPKAPTKKGYEFVGWYSDSKLENEFDFDNYRMGNQTLRLYAKWRPLTYNVTFDACGGKLAEGVPNTLTVTYDAEYGAMPIPSRTNYNFVGWFTDRTAGLRISPKSKVAITNDIELYAYWEEKASVPEDIITYVEGQSFVYDGSNHPFVFESGNISPDSFKVYYKRQVLDKEYGDSAVNAGTYDVKLVRLEDEAYRYYETVLTGVLVITKAESSIINLPKGVAWYGNVIADKMVQGVDYIGDGKIQYAVSNYNDAAYGSSYFDFTKGMWIEHWKERIAKWYDTNILTNIYDEVVTGADLYIWVRLTEGENYNECYGIFVSPEKIVATQIPDSIYKGLDDLTFKFYIKTGDITDAAMTSEVYLSLCGGESKLLSTGLERGTLSEFIAHSLVLNGISDIPFTLTYKKQGADNLGYCEWIRLDIYKGEELFIKGKQYDIEKWIELRDREITDIDNFPNVKAVSGTLKGYEQHPTGFGNFVSGVETVDLGTATEHQWSWDGFVTGKYGTYNTYEKLNAPLLITTFENTAYDKYITRTVNSYSVDVDGLYDAMTANGESMAALKVSLTADVRNGESAFAQDGLVTKTVVFNVPSVKNESVNSSYTLSSRAQPLYGALVGSNNGDFCMKYSLTENEGIWAMKFAVDYDKTQVELLGYSMGDLFTQADITLPERYDDGRYVFLANRSDSFTDITSLGTLVTLYFNNKDGANYTEYPVSVDINSLQVINAANVTVGGNTLRANSENIHVHSANRFDKQDESCTENGMQAYWYCSDCKKFFADNNGVIDESIEYENTDSFVIIATGHDWDEGVITVPAKASEEGVITYTCRKCNSTRTEPIEKLPPSIIEGANGKFMLGANEGLTFKTDAVQTDLVEVAVNGSVIGGENYTLSEENGCVCITLKAEYLSASALGEYTLDIKFTTGVASTEYTVEEGAAPTGDSENLMLWIVLITLSAGALLFLTLGKKRVH